MSCITWFVEQVRDLVVSLGKGRDRYAGARIVSLTDDVTPLVVPEGDDAPEDSLRDSLRGLIEEGWRWRRGEGRTHP